MVKRPRKDPVTGLYKIGNRYYKKLVGSRAEVWHRTAYKTTYGRDGLTRDDLVYNKRNRIVSKKKHIRERNRKQLKKLGFDTVKGKFGMVRRNVTHRNKNKKKTTKKNY